MLTDVGILQRSDELAHTGRSDRVLTIHGRVRRANNGQPTYSQSQLLSLLVQDALDQLLVSALTKTRVHPQYGYRPLLRIPIPGAVTRPCVLSARRGSASNAEARIRGS